MRRQSVLLVGLLQGTAPVAGQPAVEHVEPISERQGAGPCQVFLSPSDFEAFNISDGKLLKGIEDFEPPVSNLGPGDLISVADPLQDNVSRQTPSAARSPATAARRIPVRGATTRTAAAASAPATRSAVTRSGIKSAPTGRHSSRSAVA